MSFGAAWRTFRSGEYDRAKQLFGSLINEDYPAATTGLVRVCIAQGDLEEAQELAVRLFDFSPTPDAAALLGEVLGRRGKRKKAEELLSLAIDQAPDNGHFRVLLGEQRIRRGRWEQGAADFVTGLSARRGRDAAFRHVQEVMTDLTTAQVNGKISKADATKFINLVDYKVSSKTEEMTAFFAEVRRAITANRVMAMPGAPTPVRAEAAVPSRPPPRAAKAKSQRYEGSRSNESEGVHDQPRMMTPGSLISDMASDRALNNSLGNDVRLDAPVWPSELKDLDYLPLMKPDLLNYDSDEQLVSRLHLNEGSLQSAILIQRAMDVLKAQASRGTAGAPDPSLQGVAQLEVLCWDGLLDTVQDVPASYTHDMPDFSTALLAMGGFLGATVAGEDNFVWNYSTDPSKSLVKTDAGHFRPFDLAARWLASEDKDQVDLLGAVMQVLPAEVASRVAFLDLTYGLSDRALATRLADLWMNYRAHSNEISQADVAETINVVFDLEAVIVFAVGHQYAPPLARGPKDSALVAGAQVTIAYLRKTGEFLVLASRKHVARLLQALFAGVKQSDIAVISELVAKVYRPAMSMVLNGAESDRPHFVKFNNGATGVRLSLASNSHQERLQIVCSESSEWRVEFQ